MFAIALVSNMLCLGIDRVVIQALKDLLFSRSTVLSPAAKKKKLKEFGLHLGYHILQHHGCLHKYKIPPSVLEDLLGHLELGYTKNSNPYHNNLHASDVLQTTHWFVTQTGIQNWLSGLEIFALLFSAIIHDYDHTGKGSKRNFS
jgi:calcium/calmodulin-dependent 3',5'-cyclic nucleotide phosphodiesterase